MGVPRAILLDCFGTLVRHDESRTAQGYESTYRYLRDLGFAGAYESFLGSWDAMADGFEGRAAQTLVEFSMVELATAYLSTYGIPPVPDNVDGFVDRYLDEWRTGVSSIPGVPDVLAELRRTHRLVVVTNTHDEWLPHDVLAQFGLLAHVDAVITSIGHGRRKPSPSIFQAALDAAGVEAGEALFVGDSEVADYTGPRNAGIEAMLIDPDGRSDVPGAHRIGSVIDLPGRLRVGR